MEIVFGVQNVHCPVAMPFNDPYGKILIGPAHSLIFTITLIIR
jgi:hypothetical protein